MGELIGWVGEQMAGRVDWLGGVGGGALIGWIGGWLIGWVAGDLIDPVGLGGWINWLVTVGGWVDEFIGWVGALLI